MSENPIISIKRKIKILVDNAAGKDEQVEDLKIQLKRAFDSLEEARAEANATKDKLKRTEESRDYFEDLYLKTNNSLERLEIERDEKERALMKLTCSEEKAHCALERQFSELNEARDIAQIADMKYEEIAREMVVMKVKLDDAEKRVEEAEAKVGKSQSSMDLATRCLYSYRRDLDEVCGKELVTENRIRDLVSKLENYEAKFNMKDGEIENLQKENERLQDALFDLKVRCLNLQENRRASKVTS